MKPSKSKKSQSSLEFVVLVSFMLAVFMLFFVVSGSRILSLQGDKDGRTAKNFMSTIESEIKSAAYVNNGYSREFTLPSKIDGNPYNITILGGRELVLNYKDAEYLVFLPNGIQGNLTIGANRLTKRNGVVNITQAE